MKNIFKTLGYALTLLWAGLTANTSVAAIFEINESLSSFSEDFWFCVIDCNAEEMHQISGEFEITFDTWSSGIERIALASIDIDTNLPAGSSFEFPNYAVRFEDGEFSGNGDPCNFFSQSGTCTSQGNFGFYAGSLDGNTLTLIGAVPIDFSRSYHFEIVATAVPLPGALIFLLSSLFTLFSLSIKRSTCNK